MHYDVEHGRLFSGRQVDLFLEIQYGDLKIQRAIECKLASVRADDIDAFLAKLRLVRKEYPAAQGTIISAASFTDAVTAHAQAEGVQLTLYRDLIAKLLDGHRYANNLKKELETNERYLLKHFVEPKVGFELQSSGSPAFEVFVEWLRSGEWNQLTLLGDVGTGKSFLARVLAHRLVIEYLEDPLSNPLPILIDLRNADREFSLEGMILTHLSQTGLERVSFSTFEHILAEGNIILLLDGFDEMAARVTPLVTTRNFQELARSVKGRSKVLLTCRTHYFKSRSEEEDVILGGATNYGSELARELYWDLVSRRGFRITYVRPFELAQIEEYVHRVRPQDSRLALEKIRNTYNLLELSHRPLLLNMIVRSIDRLESGDINAAVLYSVFTDAWINRDKWRDALPAEAKLQLLMTLAYTLWQEQITSVHYSRLLTFVKDSLQLDSSDSQQMLEIDNDVRTSTFLVRDAAGNYGFAHKSYLEFFLARNLSRQIATIGSACLRIRRLTPEVFGFLKDLTDREELVSLAEELVAGEYETDVSENALLCLYWMKRFKTALDQASNSEDQVMIVPLLSGIKMRGASLQQITLEGSILHAIDLRDARLDETILVGCELKNALCSGVSLRGANLARCDLRGVDLRNASLTSANLDGANLVGANLEGADLTDANIINVIWGVNETSSAYVSKTITRADADSIRRFWEIIERRRERFAAVAKVISQGTSLEPEDLLSETIIALWQSQHRRKFLLLEDLDLENYFKFVAGTIIRQSREPRVVSLETMSHDTLDHAMWELITTLDLDEFSWDEFDFLPDEYPNWLRELLDPQTFRIFVHYHIFGSAAGTIARKESLSAEEVKRRVEEAYEVWREQEFANEYG